MQNLFHKIIPADIRWENDTPVSNTFDDIYYSQGDGLEETHYIFLGLNKLEQRWQALQSEQTFTIAETGFGTALNFLAAAKLWLRTAPSSAQLHFISIEKHPLTKEDLQLTLKQWPELSSEVNELLQHYPPLTPGYHRRHLFNNRIHLTLIFDDITNCMPSAQWQANAWFLDGFAPGCNPDMWNENTLGQLNRLSQPDATLATFTVAGSVRRALQAQDFYVEKVPGFGKKREVLYGKKSAKNSPVEKPLRFDDKPWFHYSPDIHPDKTAIIIGAGLAGCSAAHALSKRHWQVHLLDSNPDIAQATSGNHTGMIYTKFSHHNSPQNRFYQQSFLYSSALVKHLENSGALNKADWDGCGILQIAFDNNEEKKQQSLLDNNHCPDYVLRGITQNETKALCGWNTNKGLFLPQGGWIHPPALCNALIQSPNIRFSGNTTIENIIYNEESKQWHCLDGNKNSICNSSVLIIANAQAANQFEQTQWLPLKSISGQISLLKETTESKQLKTVICYDGYIAPSYQHMHSTGATFHLDSSNTQVTREDHQTNLEKLQRDLPELPHFETTQIQGGRAGVRCQTPDYLPIAGKIPDIACFKKLYGKYTAGQRKGQLQAPVYYSALYALTAMGSRGICFAPYAAEILASQINGDVLPVDKNVAQHLAPARLAYRNLSKNNNK